MGHGFVYVVFTEGPGMDDATTIEGVRGTQQRAETFAKELNGGEALEWLPNGDSVYAYLGGGTGHYRRAVTIQPCELE